MQTIINYYRLLQNTADLFRSFKTIVAYHRLFQNIAIYCRLSQTIADYRKLWQIIANYCRLSQTIADYHGPKKLDTYALISNLPTVAVFRCRIVLDWRVEPITGFRCKSVLILFFLRLLCWLAKKALSSLPRANERKDLFCNLANPATAAVEKA